MKSARKSSRTTPSNPSTPYVPSSSRRSSISNAIQNSSNQSPRFPISSAHPDVELVLDKLAAEQRSEHLFLKLLAQFTRQGRNTSEKPSSRTYAPTMFAKESEAREMSIRKPEFEAAMRRLFEAEKLCPRTIRATMQGNVKIGTPHMTCRTYVSPHASPVCHTCLTPVCVTPLIPRAGDTACDTFRWRGWSVTVGREHLIVHSLAPFLKMLGRAPHE